MVDLNSFRNSPDLVYRILLRFDIVQIAIMEDISQVFNAFIGRNQDTGGICFWENPERAGWLMKQGSINDSNVLHVGSKPLLKRA